MMNHREQNNLSRIFLKTVVCLNTIAKKITSSKICNIKQFLTKIVFKKKRFSVNNID